jgi:hypothetical protein
MTNESVYEMVEINRHTEKLEADTLRIGKRYKPFMLGEGGNGILFHADNENKALITSFIQEIITINPQEIKFRTKHTTYHLRAVEE